VPVNVYVIFGDSPQINLKTAAEKFSRSQAPFAESFLFEALHFNFRELCHLVLQACNHWLNIQNFSQFNENTSRRFVFNNDS